MFHIPCAIHVPDHQLFFRLLPKYHSHLFPLINVYQIVMPTTPLSNTSHSFVGSSILCNDTDSSKIRPYANHDVFDERCLSVRNL